MAKTKRSEETKIVTPEFRIAYPHLFKAQAMPGTKNAPKFSITMLFDKTSDMDVLKKAMTAAKIDKFGPDKKQWPVMASAVKNGDDPKYADKEGFKGHHAISASTNEDQRPGVVDRNGNDILDPAILYPGCYARAAVMAYIWEFPKDSGKYGVGFILDHVQKLRDGKSFGGKKPASAVFGRVEGAADEDTDVQVEEDTDDFK